MEVHYFKGENEATRKQRGWLPFLTDNHDESKIPLNSKAYLHRSPGA